MAKRRYIRVVFDSASSRTAEVSLSEGESLTGRWYADVDFQEVQPFMIEVWNRSTLTLQSKRIPAIPADNETALVSQWITNTSYEFGEMVLLRENDGSKSGLILSGVQPGATAKDFVVFVEINF